VMGRRGAGDLEFPPFTLDYRLPLQAASGLPREPELERPHPSLPSPYRLAPTTLLFSALVLSVGHLDTVPSFGDSAVLRRQIILLSQHFHP